MADSGTYLYAIAGERDRADPAELRDLPGVAGATVRTVTGGDLIAYVSTVPLEEFGEEPLRRSLEDLGWVGETARAHHRVVETVARRGATAPVRLVTVYSGDEQVRDVLDRRHDDFAAMLAHVAGRREWGVKVYARPGESAPGPEEPAEPAAGGPGTAYLRRRRAGLRSREQAWREATARAERVHGALARMSVACMRHRPQDPHLSGRQDTMVLNGAYLVEDGRSEEFAATVDGLREPGVDVELTGPWAPYSFTGPDFGTPGDHDDA